MEDDNKSHGYMDSFDDNFNTTKRKHIFCLFRDMTPEKSSKINQAETK